MFLDETGSTTNLLRRYGRAPRGARVHDHAPCGRWQTSTFLAALRVTGLTAPGVFDGAIDGESFRAYIDQILVPTLQPGDIVIADNLGAHKVAHKTRCGSRPGSTRVSAPRCAFGPTPSVPPLRAPRVVAPVRLVHDVLRVGVVGVREPVLRAHRVGRDDVPAGQKRARPNSSAVSTARTPPSATGTGVV